MNPYSYQGGRPPTNWNQNNYNQGQQRQQASSGGMWGRYQDVQPPQLANRQNFPSQQQQSSNFEQRSMQELERELLRMTSAASESNRYTKPPTQQDFTQQQMLMLERELKALSEKQQAMSQPAGYRSEPPPRAPPPSDAKSDTLDDMIKSLEMAVEIAKMKAVEKNDIDGKGKTSSYSKHDSPERYDRRRSGEERHRGRDSRDRSPKHSRYRSRSHSRSRGRRRSSPKQSRRSSSRERRSSHHRRDSRSPHRRSRSRDRNRRHSRSSERKTRWGRSRSSDRDRERSRSSDSKNRERSLSREIDILLKNSSEAPADANKTPNIVIPPFPPPGYMGPVPGMPVGPRQMMPPFGMGFPVPPPGFMPPGMGPPMMGPGMMPPMMNPNMPPVERMPQFMSGGRQPRMSQRMHWQNRPPVSPFPPVSLGGIFPIGVNKQESVPIDADAALKDRLVFVYIAHIPINIHDQYLRNVVFMKFRTYGVIEAVKIGNPGEYGSRYIAVCFKNAPAANTAIKAGAVMLAGLYRSTVDSFHDHLDVFNASHGEPDIDETFPGATRTLVIDGLPSDITPAEIRRSFEKFGTILNVTVQREKGKDGSSARVEYTDILDVCYVLTVMKESKHTNLSMRLWEFHFANPKPSKEVWFGGLPEQFHTEETFKREFNGSRMEGVFIMPKTAQAIATYCSVEAAKCALVEFQGKVFDDKRIRVDFSTSFLAQHLVVAQQPARKAAHPHDSGRSTDKVEVVTVSDNDDDDIFDDSDERTAISVKNLPPALSGTKIKDGLHNHFKQYGKIAALRMIQPDPGKERYVVIQFTAPLAAKRAVKRSRNQELLDLFGSPLRIEFEEEEVKRTETTDEFVFVTKPTKTLLLTGLEANTTVSIIEKLSQPFGEILEAFIRKRQNMTAAFVHFYTIGSVKKAIAGLDGVSLGKSVVTAGFAATPRSTCVWVENVPTKIELIEAFIQCGPILEVTIDTEANHALIVYENSSLKCAEAAVAEFNETTVGGKTILVDFANRATQSLMIVNLRVSRQHVPDYWKKRVQQYERMVRKKQRSLFGVTGELEIPDQVESPKPLGEWEKRRLQINKSELYRSLPYGPEERRARKSQASKSQKPLSALEGLVNVSDDELDFDLDNISDDDLNLSGESDNDAESINDPVKIEKVTKRVIDRLVCQVTKQEAIAAYKRVSGQETAISVTKDLSRMSEQYTADDVPLEEDDLQVVDMDATSDSEDIVLIEEFVPCAEGQKTETGNASNVAETDKGTGEAQMEMDGAGTQDTVESALQNYSSDVIAENKASPLNKDKDVMDITESEGGDVSAAKDKVTQLCTDAGPKPGAAADSGKSQKEITIVDVQKAMDAESESHGKKETADANVADKGSQEERKKVSTVTDAENKKNPSIGAGVPASNEKDDKKNSNVEILSKEKLKDSNSSKLPENVTTTDVEKSSENVPSKVVSKEEIKPAANSTSPVTRRSTRRIPAKQQPVNEPVDDDVIELDDSDAEQPVPKPPQMRPQTARRARRRGRR